MPSPAPPAPLQWVYHLMCVATTLQALAFMVQGVGKQQAQAALNTTNVAEGPAGIAATC